MKSRRNKTRGCTQCTDNRMKMIKVNFINSKIRRADLECFFALIGGQILDPDCLILRRRCESAPILRPGKRVDLVAMPVES